MFELAAAAPRRGSGLGIMSKANQFGLSTLLAAISVVALWLCSAEVIGHHIERSKAAEATAQKAGIANPTAVFSLP